MLDTSSRNMPEGVPTENFLLFGVVEIAKLRSASWYSSNRVLHRVLRERPAADSPCHGCPL